MAIEDEREEHAQWAGVAASWYIKASDRHPHIRLRVGRWFPREATCEALARITIILCRCYISLDRSTLAGRGTSTFAKGGRRRREVAQHCFYSRMPEKLGLGCGDTCDSCIHRLYRGMRGAFAI